METENWILFTIAQESAPEIESPISTDPVIAGHVAPTPPLQI